MNYKRAINPSVPLITIGTPGFSDLPKGQLVSKADWHAIDSPKKRTGEFDLFALLLFTANKSNSSVRFLGESTARQSAFRFYHTFTALQYKYSPQQTKKPIIYLLTLSGIPNYYN